MGDFKKENNFEQGRRRFERRDGGRLSFNNQDRGPAALFKATCAKCGVSCEVPFRPTGGRPIYCRDCFQGKNDAGDGVGGSRFSKKDYGGKNYSRPDFRSGVGSNDGLRSQLESINVKMDRLIKAVEAMTNIRPSAPKEQSGETTEPILDAKIKKSRKKVAKKNSYKRPF